MKVARDTTGLWEVTDTEPKWFWFEICEIKRFGEDMNDNTQSDGKQSRVAYGDGWLKLEDTPTITASRSTRPANEEGLERIQGSVGSSLSRLWAVET